MLKAIAIRLVAAMGTGGFAGVAALVVLVVAAIVSGGAAEAPPGISWI